jgi:hypothetical protein
MNETQTQICTECYFTGEPNLSVGRLSIEFLVNFLIGNGWGVPFFVNVRHCPECGSHSMVLMTSESGQNALAELKKKRLEKKECDLCGGALSGSNTTEDTQLCENCKKEIFEQQPPQE